jgi:4-amino-4-deoxy-L-arabinose transferase-like glycosyltransferase
VLLATINRYDYHRDELYFRLLGQHPAWGYVDQPPATPLLARLAIEALGDRLWAIRLPALLCILAATVLSALIARELGGGRLAQTLAGLGLLSVFPLVAGHLLLTATLDLVVWTAVILFVVRALQREEPRWWPAAGVVVGLGLYNKHLIGLLLVGLAVGLLLVGPRRILLSGPVWTGVAIAVVLGSPNLVYQLVHHFPQLEMATALARNKGDEARITLVPLQFLLLGPLLAPVWIAGLVKLLREPAWRRLRALALAYPVICVLLLVIAGQPYYTLGLLVGLFAAGCVPTAAWLAGHVVRRTLVAAAVLVNGAASTVLALPVVPLGVLGHTPIPQINQAIRDQVGWQVYVQQIADAYARLAPDEQRQAVIVTGNYGEAGSIDRYGGRWNLPKVYSGQNELFNFGPPPESASVVIAVFHDGRRLLAQAFATCDVEGVLDNGVGVDNEEQGTPVRICRGRRLPWREVWPAFQHYD